MVKLTAELILKSEQYTSCVLDREIDLRGSSHHFLPGGRGLQLASKATTFPR
jgi:hypothetical protein